MKLGFVCPWAFLCLVPFAVAAWRMLRRATRGGVKFAPLYRIPSKATGWRARLDAVAPYLFLLGMLSMIVALSRPRIDRSYDERIDSSDAVAIAMTVDVSGSMEALDLTPKGEQYQTRLEVVKRKFREFVSRRPHDLIGLVTFGGYAASRAPLTADHEALLHTLSGVEIPVIGYDAAGNPVDAEETLTAIGDGLVVALDRLRGVDMKSKVVVLLSDGVSNTGAVEPDEAAKAAAKMGVKVYTIGVGTKSSRVPVKAKDRFGRTTIQYATGVEFDETQLRRIASITGGRYFSVGDASGLDQALEEIDALEKTEVKSVRYENYDEWFYAFLSFGATVLMFALFLQMATSRRLA